jgi:hypothetical protein
MFFSSSLFKTIEFLKWSFVNLHYSFQSFLGLPNGIDQPFHLLQILFKPDRDTLFVQRIGPGAAVHTGRSHPADTLSNIVRGYPAG